MTPSRGGRSIQRKLLTPLLLLMLGCAALALVVSYRISRDMAAEQLRIRASMLASMTNYSAEVISHAGELQRVVAALGAEPDVAEIVVVSGIPARVLASTRGEWLGLSPGAIPESDIRHDLAEAIRARRSTAEFSATSERFGYATPLLLNESLRTTGQQSHGAVMVRLDTRPMNRSIQRTALQLLIGMFTLFVLIGLASYAIVLRRVIFPIRTLTRVVDRIRAGTPIEWPAPSHDEIGVLTATLRSTTERADAALRRLKDLEFAMDQHCIVSITDARGRITYANPRLIALSGYTEAELLGQDHRILNSGQHGKPFFKELWKTIQAGEVWSGEMENRTKDGTRFWVATTIVPLPGADGKPEQYIAMRTDIAQQKEQASSLAAARDRAETAVRAKNEFLATMSHEIRTPMNGVLGFADLLLQTPLDTEQQEFTQTIRNSGAALLAIIDDILDLSKLEAGRLTVEREVFDPRQAIAEACALLLPRANDQQVTLRVEHLEPEPRMLLADSDRFRQVFLNLLGNAIKFTRGGHVTIRTRLTDERGAMLRVEVIDDGIGISAEAIPRLFTKFIQADATTSRRYGGTGLGLAISKQLTECMGGQVGVESELGKGSTFWFALPLAVHERHSATLHSLSPVGAASGAADPPLGLRVLVAEDTLINQLLVTRVLENLGCSTALVTNGREALAKLENEPFDIVLMDCHMPEMDGFEACAEWREREARLAPGRRRMPVIALTASVMQEDREHCRAVGMDGVIEKPFRPADLRAMLVRHAA